MTNTVKISDLVNGGATTVASIPQVQGSAALKTKEEEEKKPIEKKAKTTVAPSGKFTSAWDVITSNHSKLVNCKPLEVKEDNVPEGKYLFYSSNDQIHGEIYQVHDPKELQLLNKDCDAIIVHSSGVVIKSSTHRTYIMKTNVIQYVLNDKGYPISRLTISKTPASGGDPSTKEYTKTTKVLNSDEKLKTVLKKEAITLYNKIVDFQTVDSIKEEAIKFMDTKKDILYLIKIENILLDTI